MAPSSKSEKDGNKQTQRKHKEHVVKLLNRGKLSGQYSQRLFRKLPPRVCVPLKNIVSEEFLRAGHIFLGFTKCGRYVLSYTSDCGEDDDFSFYTYHLYWWEFNLHSRLKQVHHVRLFTGEDIYSDLYLTVCEWPNDHSKIVIFGFNTRSSSSVLMNLMMSDENNRDIYITIASMPPLRPCSQCCPPNTSTIQCLEHGYMLNSRYQVVYPFPTFQPAFQLKKDQVIFLNTSYSLVACSVSLCPGRRQQHQTPPSPSSSSSSHGSPDSRLLTAKPSPAPLSPSQSHAAARAREFAADLFRRAQGGGRENEGGERRGNPEGSEREDTQTDQLTSDSIQCSAMTSPASSSSSPPTPHSSQEAGCSEPGYVNYTRLQYRIVCLSYRVCVCPTECVSVLQSVCLSYRVCVCPTECVSVLQSVCVEQLTLDFEYLINEVIRSDARWAAQFCSFNDYDVVILEVCPETNTVVINIGLLLLAFSNPEEEHCRPNTYHSSLQVSWDLNTGVCHTVGVGDLTEVKGQTSGSVWSSYRKSCVNTVMKWLVPESSSRYINRMTNEALHKGTHLYIHTVDKTSPA
uniref:DDB1 and CUL4 associated factor 15 n=1 Tax=Oncorhynchus mykiss TaxID=8022 RepID=A0A8K9Y4T8_ONCMY